jgi:hypothetical protein
VGGSVTRIKARRAAERQYEVDFQSVASAFHKSIQRAAFDLRRRFVLAMRTERSVRFIGAASAWLDDAVMVKLATQIAFGDYAKWRAGFDKAAPLREKAGMKNVQIYRDVDNPTSALIWSDIDDPAKARAVLDSPELRKAMQDAGVVGAPKIHVIP